MTTHRTTQLRCLVDNLRSAAFQNARASRDAISADNQIQAEQFMRRFNRCCDIAFRVKQRLDRQRDLARLARRG